MTDAGEQTQAARQDRLAPGVRLRWQGGTYRVLALQGPEVQLGCLDKHGHDARALVAAVVGAEDYALLNEDNTAVLPAATVPDTSGLSLLTEEQRRLVRDWERHLIEIDDGVPPDAPAGTVPRPGYDPQYFTVRQRLTAKAAELKALGFASASPGTVERRRRAYRARGVFGLIRETVPGSPWGRTDERVVKLLLAEIKAGRYESDGYGSRLYERLQAAVRNAHPGEYEALMISPATFYRLLKRLGIGVDSLRWSTERRMDSTVGPVAPYTPTRALRLGEQVQIDSTGLDILAVGDDGRVVQVELTAAIDVASRSIIGAMIVPKTPGRGPRGRRLGGRATRSFDAVLMLAQALAPMPGRPGWPVLAYAEHSEMPYTDLVACDPRIAGAAARPVIRPRTVVVDHGKIFNSEHFGDVCRMLGIDVRPARVRTPTDKAIIESTFSAIKKRFGQHVAGYTGSDLARRGKHVADQVLWSLNELQDLLDEWIALDWQQTPHDGLRSPFLPGLAISPNRMYATLVAAEGHVPVPLSAHHNRKLLPFVRVKVTDKGVKINNRTYNSAQLQDYKDRHTGLAGQGMRWQIRYNPYAPRYAWLYDHREDDWVQAEFIHQRLIADAWTQWTWEAATLSVIEDGGTEEDQRRIARAVSELREKARHGPEPLHPPRVPELFTGPKLDLAIPEADPYAGMPDPDPDTVVRAPALTGHTTHLIAAGDTVAPHPPAPARPSGGGQRPNLSDAAPDGVQEHCVRPDLEDSAHPGPPDAPGPVTSDDESEDADGNVEHPGPPQAGAFSLRGSAADIFGCARPTPPPPEPGSGTTQPDGPHHDNGDAR
ncbi:Mu transposase C-terminal domain-containing protein [Streptomyces chrestomyceticus]|uniref:Mu transposase C-terminal domain-containing protein n=1 Tax=Streptomyces chrestomyceticus TaxID=68185 RepID=A0ABU7WQT1_9ACTN